jgi:hypothetical protein
VLVLARYDGTPNEEAPRSLNSLGPLLSEDGPISPITR